VQRRKRKIQEERENQAASPHQVWGVSWVRWWEERKQVVHSGKLKVVGEGKWRRKLLGGKIACRTAQEMGRTGDLYVPAGHTLGHSASPISQCDWYVHPFVRASVAIKKHTQSVSQNCRRQNGLISTGKKTGKRKEDGRGGQGDGGGEAEG
jgi:hypothetical protein